VAEAAVWLCSERASFVSGESLVVDGAAISR
jgi:NAD(P)-dependent dehydrogenase (short-subunit alcohol dehydrogenase family)